MAEGGDLPRTLVADLARCVGERVRLCGWAQEIRADDRVVVLRDHTGVVHIVSRSDRPDETVVAELVPESAVVAVGVVEAATDGHVVALTDLTVVGPALGPVPVTGRAPLDARLDWRYLDLRRPRNRLIFEVQTTAERVMRELWHEHGFLEIHSPKLRAQPNKSGTQLFALDYFGRRAYLAQSPQFPKQMAMAAGFDRVFEVGPVFRAQGEPTSRHDTEFTSVDIEVSWISSHEDLMAFEEQMLRRVIAAVAREHGGQVARCFGVELTVPSVPFPRVSLPGAKEIVAAAGGTVGGPDDDLDPDGERLLAAHVARENGHEFVWITDYPELSRPFYHMRCEDGTDATRSFDLLWKGLEITSGAQREHRYDRLVEQARRHGIPVELIGGYLDFFRYGCPPHGGFGLGLTRLLMSLFELADVREVTYLFRGPDRLTP